MMNIHQSQLFSMKFSQMEVDTNVYKPTDPRLRVATWGTVIWDGNSFIPLSQGGLPGRLQTVHRAEITLSLKPIRIWTDKKNVYDILVALWATEVDISRKAVFEISGTGRSTNGGCPNMRLQEVVKEQAHADPNTQKFPIETWAVLGNEAADRCAATVRHSLPPTFWTELKQIKQWGVALHAMYTDIAHHALQPTLDPDLLQPTGVQFLDIAEVDIEFCNLATLRADQIDQLPKRFQRCRRKFWAVRCHQPDNRTHSGFVPPATHRLPK